MTEISEQPEWWAASDTGEPIQELQERIRLAVKRARKDRTQATKRKRRKTRGWGSGR